MNSAALCQELECFWRRKVLGVSASSQGLGLGEKPGSEESCASFLAQHLPPLGSALSLLQPATFLIPSVCVYLGFFPAVAIPDLSLHRFTREWIFFPPTFGLLLPSQPELSNLATVHTP